MHPGLTMMSNRYGVMLGAIASSTAMHHAIG